MAGSWLKKQAIWQIYLPPPHFIPRPMFDEERPNAVNQCDLLCMPCVDRKTYRYCLMIIDVGSRFKVAEPIVSKDSNEVAAVL